MSTKVAQGLTLFVGVFLFLAPSPGGTADKKNDEDRREIHREDHRKKVIEEKDPHALWLLFRRNGILGLPVFQDTLGADAPRFADEVTVRSCEAFLEEFARRIRLDFEDHLKKLPDKVKKQNRAAIEEQRKKLWPLHVERLFKSLGIPKDWEEENQKKIERFKKKYPEGVVLSTKHYHILSTADKRTTRALGARMDIVSEQVYETIFDFEEKIPWKYIIRFYGSKAEYRRNGGPRGMLAHYHPQTKELVGYDQAKSAKDKTKSYESLFHEGWHQYFDYYIPGSPRWFDEGFAELISPTRIKRGRAIRNPFNPERHRMVLHALRNDALIPLPRLIKMGYEDFMEDAGVAYAQSWSFTYFLTNFKHRDKKIQSRVREFYRAYFWELHKGTGPSEAADIVFKDVRLDQLEAAWKKAIPLQRRRR